MVGAARAQVALVVCGQARKEMPANLDRLKTRLETGAAATLIGADGAKVA